MFEEKEDGKTHHWLDDCLPGHSSPCCDAPVNTADDGKGNKYPECYKCHKELT